jgi:hypothetical protein
MRASRCSSTVFLLIVTTLIGSLLGQQAPMVASSAPVPQLVNYSVPSAEFQNASEHRHLLALQCLASAPSSRDADDQTLLIPWSICRATPVLLSYFLG